MRKTIRYFWISKRKIDTWAESKNIFFILAIGRSGTKFLADLLSKAPGAYVVHEPVRADFLAYQRAFHSEEEAMKYIQVFRKREIYLRCRDRKINTYGEVNSALRRHCNALKHAFPKAVFIHLIRDGRDVLRSMMSRKTMTSEDPNTRLIYPVDGDPYRDSWPKMTRFERLCWYWQVENQYLRKYIAKTIRLEELVSSYDYFKRELLDPLGLQLSEEVWQKAAESPKNVTENYAIPHWSEWPRSKLDAFLGICGEEMEANGYQID